MVNREKKRLAWVRKWRRIAWKKMWAMRWIALDISAIKYTFSNIEWNFKFHKVILFFLVGWICINRHLLAARCRWNKFVVVTVFLFFIYFFASFSLSRFDWNRFENLCTFCNTWKRWNLFVSFLQLILLQFVESIFIEWKKKQSTFPISFVYPIGYTDLFHLSQYN